MRYFLLAAREKNITRAAEPLHVTQPTLSRQLMQLEQELGTKLFHRGQYSITLTDDGMLFKRRAQELIDLADKTEQEFVKTEGSLTGELSIGSGETLSMHTLSQWIASFRAENLLVQYDIYSATADEIKDRLKKVFWIWDCWWGRWTLQNMSLSVCQKRALGCFGFRGFHPCLI